MRFSFHPFPPPPQKEHHHPTSRAGWVASRFVWLKWVPDDGEKGQKERRRKGLGSELCPGLQTQGGAGAQNPVDKNRAGPPGEGRGQSLEPWLPNRAGPVPLGKGRGLCMGRGGARSPGLWELSWARGWGAGRRPPLVLQRCLESGWPRLGLLRQALGFHLCNSCCLKPSTCSSTFLGGKSNLQGILKSWEKSKLVKFYLLLPVVSYS